MFGSPILDVAIGLVFVYLLLSLIATALRETMEAWMKSRAGQLELGIRTLLQDLSGDDLARKVYEHPLIYGLYGGKYEPPAGGGQRIRRGSSLPSYIPPRPAASPPEPRHRPSRSTGFEAPPSVCRTSRFGARCSPPST
jgi:hypothetical protein